MWQRDFVDVIKFKDLEVERLWVIWVGSVESQGSFVNGREAEGGHQRDLGEWMSGQEGTTMLALKTEEGTTRPEMWTSSRG